MFIIINYNNVSRLIQPFDMFNQFTFSALMVTIINHHMCVYLPQLYLYFDIAHMYAIYHHEVSGYNKPTLISSFWFRRPYNGY